MKACVSVTRVRSTMALGHLERVKRVSHRVLRLGLSCPRHGTVSRARRDPCNGRSSCRFSPITYPVRATSGPTVPFFYLRTTKRLRAFPSRGANRNGSGLQGDRRYRRAGPSICRRQVNERRIELRNRVNDMSCRSNDERPV